MKHEQTIQVPEDEIAEMNEILQRSEFIEDAGRDEVIKLYRTIFDDGYEVDIKVCNGNSPFVDAILFHNGREICVLDPCFENIDGEYHFWTKNFNEGDEYVVIIEEE